MVERVSPRIRAQLVMLTYYNPIMRRGAERFCQQAKAAGASGATQPRLLGKHMFRYCGAPVPLGRGPALLCVNCKQAPAAACHLSR